MSEPVDKKVYVRFEDGSKGQYVIGYYTPQTKHKDLVKLVEVVGEVKVRTLLYSV